MSGPDRRLASPAFVLVAILVVAAAATGGWLLGRGAPSTASDHGAHAPASGGEAGKTIYTCSMHPQIRLDRPGNCPICEMPLVPLSGQGGGGSGEAPSLQLSEHAMSMASVETAEVSRRELVHQLRAVGKVQWNESSLATVTARVDGYAERLFVNFTGVEIKAGDHLAEIYSPELLVAQQELLITMKSAGGGAPALVETAKQKLRRFGLTDQQIADLVEKETIADRVTLYSPITGTVIEKMIVENSSFETGDALYRVANLDSVWVYTDIYEFDLAWVRYGQEVAIIAEALPGREFRGMVSFVQPIVDDRTRTIRVPVHVENPEHVLKPGMFVSATIRATLGADGRAAKTGVEGKWSCPMHPQVLADSAGRCTICEMPLERIPGADEKPVEVSRAPPSPRWHCPMKCEGAKTYPAAGNCPECGMKLEELPPAGPTGPGLLAVPNSAVLDSGLRRIVYVERSRGLFEAREITIGPRTGEWYPVLSGLEEGERVVARGGFLIDSQFQITGHPSLFYPGGLMAGPSGASPPPAGGHAGHEGK